VPEHQNTYVVVNDTKTEVSEQVEKVLIKLKEEVKATENLAEEEIVVK